MRSCFSLFLSRAHHPLPDTDVLAITSRSRNSHAFKFLPVIGDVVHKRYHNKLAPSLTKRFSFLHRGGDVGADIRAGLADGRKLLLADELCEPTDLKCGLKEKLELEAAAGGPTASKL